jgi:hypothetical protein
MDTRTDMDITSSVRQSKMFTMTPFLLVTVCFPISSTRSINKICGELNNAGMNTPNYDYYKNCNKNELYIRKLSVLMHGSIFLFSKTPV